MATGSGELTLYAAALTVVAAAGTSGLVSSTAGVASTVSGSVAAAGSAAFSSAAGSVAAGFSVTFSDFLPFTVCRSLPKEKPDDFFSPSSSEAGDFSFLPKAKGKLDLRFSLLTSFLVSPLVAGVASTVSVGRVEATSVERGASVSTGGMTGAVSAMGAVSGTGSASLAGVTGAASPSAFFLPKDRLPKMLFFYISDQVVSTVGALVTHLERLEGVGLVSGFTSAAGVASAAGVSAAASTAGVSVIGSTGATGSSTAGAASAVGSVAGVSSVAATAFSSFLASSFLPKERPPKRLFRFLLKAGLVSTALGSSTAGVSVATASVAAGVSAGVSAATTGAGVASFLTMGVGLKLSTVFLKPSDSVTVVASSLASAILSFSCATQLSRSAALADLKVCLWPLA